MTNPSMSMVEKVARALCMEAGKHPDRDSRDTDGYPNWIFYKSAARAAIAAYEASKVENPIVSGKLWSHVLDAALTEDKQGE